MTYRRSIKIIYRDLKDPTMANVDDGERKLKIFSGSRRTRFPAVAVLYATSKRSVCRLPLPKT